MSPSHSVARLAEPPASLSHPFVRRGGGGGGGGGGGVSRAELLLRVCFPARCSGTVGLISARAFVPLRFLLVRIRRTVQGTPASGLLCSALRLRVRMQRVRGGGLYFRDKTLQGENARFCLFLICAFSLPPLTITLSSTALHFHPLSLFPLSPFPFAFLCSLSSLPLSLHLYLPSHSPPSHYPSISISPHSPSLSFLPPVLSHFPFFNLPSPAPVSSCPSLSSALLPPSLLPLSESIVGDSHASHVGKAGRRNLWDAEGLRGEVI